MSFSPPNESQLKQSEEVPPEFESCSFNKISTSYGLEENPAIPVTLQLVK